MPELRPPIDAALLARVRERMHLVPPLERPVGDRAQGVQEATNSDPSRLRSKVTFAS